MEVIQLKVHFDYEVRRIGKHQKSAGISGRCVRPGNSKNGVCSFAIASRLLLDVPLPFCGLVRNLGTDSLEENDSAYFRERRPTQCREDVRKNERI